MIWLTQSDVPGLPGGAVSARFGGISLYGRSRQELDQAVEIATSAICAASKEHLLFTRDLLRRAAMQVHEGLSEQRLFSALLGLCLRRGDLDTLICTASTGKRYWSVFHGVRTNDIDSALAFILKRAVESGNVSIGEVRQQISPDAEWGSWSIAQNILCRAVTVGIVVQTDKYNFQVSGDLKHALSRASVEFATIRAGRMGFC